MSHSSPRRLWRRSGEGNAPHADVRRRDWPTLLGIGTAIVAALGALIFNGISATATSNQLELSRDGQLTDRYSRAVEQLGSDSPEVRLGGIYALERLMRDSPADQPTIVEVLAAFVRSHAARRPSPSLAPATTLARDDIRAAAARRPVDLVAALTVIGRRDTRQDTQRTAFDPSYSVLDLSHSDLDGLNLRGVRLRGANLNGTSLIGSSLNGADLSGASLISVDLTDAKVQLANLSCASMIGAKLTGTDLSGSNLSGVALGGATLSGANLTNTNLTGANFGFEGPRLTGTTGSPRPQPTMTLAPC
jgi:hypothetical protein